ncbi:MAG: NADH:ubiquinone oxidoreductase [Bacteroidales bacterium]|nr:NADH:ubiquinone oxidoreductase [Bacteroidales bacterium]
MFKSLKIFLHNGKQYIPDIRAAKAPGVFRGRPVISTEKVDGEALKDVCPAGAISLSPVSIDLGRCLFCGECEHCFPAKIHFTDDCHLATNVRERLIVREGEDKPIELDKSLIRPEIRKAFRNSLKLRQVSAGGDGSCEAELNATGNVQFDMGRFGIEFAASPRHADGVLVTGPVSANMAEALQLTYDAVSEPKVIILDGTDAISGGMYADSPDVDRSFIENHEIDLYIPGNPAHPLTIINGLLDLTR